MRELNDFQQAVVRDVTEQVVNMLTNNVLEGNGTETFEGWCEDGDVFDSASAYQNECCIKLMKEVAPIVDELTYKYLNLGY